MTWSAGAGAGSAGAGALGAGVAGALGGGAGSGWAWLRVGVASNTAPEAISNDREKERRNDCTLYTPRWGTAGP
jgi:hypothetical protein